MKFGIRLHPEQAATRQGHRQAVAAMVKAGGKKKRRGEVPTFEKKAAGPNLFERMSNKKRFDVLGKKVKGETRHTGRLRTAAVEKVRGTGGQCQRWCCCVSGAPPPQHLR